MNFYKYLNETKIREVKILYQINYLASAIDFGGANTKQTTNFQKGDLLADNDNLYIQINEVPKISYEKIGAITKPEELDSIFISS